MRKFLKRALLVSAFTLLALVTAVVGIVLWDRPPASAREYFALQNEWRQIYKQARGSAPDHVACRQQFAEHCLQLAAKYPGTGVELAALSLAEENAPDTPAGKTATDQLPAKIAVVDIDQLRRAMMGFGMGVGLRSRPAALHVFARLKKHLDYPGTPLMLANISSYIASASEDREPPPAFAEIAELIVSRFPDNPDIHNFCLVLGPGYSSPLWAPRFEPHLRRILEVNQNRLVRCNTLMALAQIAQASPDRQAEAEQGYQALLQEFDIDVKDPWQNVIQQVCHNARTQLEAMQFASIGKPAPEIAGLDLNGKQMTLSEYRGKVVLVTFWATWCYPCMKLVPHEKALADRHAGQPFAVVGVNADNDIAKAIQAEDEKSISWRSFRDKREGTGAISDEWNALFPTVYLIDHKGVVRQRYSGSPNPDVMQKEVEELVAAAMKNDAGSPHGPTGN